METRKLKKNLLSIIKRFFAFKGLGNSFFLHLHISRQDVRWSCDSSSSRESGVLRLDGEGNGTFFLSNQGEKSNDQSYQRTNIEKQVNNRHPVQLKMIFKLQSCSKFYYDHSYFAKNCSEISAIANAMVL